MKTIIDSKNRTVKFSQGKGKGFTLSLNFHGVCCKPHHLEAFNDVCFLRDYVKSYGTQRQADYLLFNTIEAIEILEEPETITAEPTKVMAFLSVDAWNEGDEIGSEEGASWSWNNWYLLREIEGVTSLEAAHNFFVEELGEAIEDELRFCVIDDGYYYVLSVIADDYRPIYAIEHGGGNKNETSR